MFQASHTFPRCCRKRRLFQNHSFQRRPGHETLVISSRPFRPFLRGPLPSGTDNGHAGKPQRRYVRRRYPENRGGTIRHIRKRRDNPERELRHRRPALRNVCRANSIRRNGIGTQEHSADFRGTTMSCSSTHSNINTTALPVFGVGEQRLLRVRRN